MRLGQCLVQQDLCAARPAVPVQRLGTGKKSFRSRPHLSEFDRLFPSVPLHPHQRRLREAPVPLGRRHELGEVRSPANPVKQVSKSGCLDLVS